MSDAPVWVGTAKVIIETDQALLVRIDEKDYWVPKSQVHDDSEVWKARQEGKFIVSEWFAEKKGWV